MTKAVYSHELLRSNPIVTNLFNHRENKKDSFERWYNKNVSLIHSTLWSNSLAD